MGAGGWLVTLPWQSKSRQTTGSGNRLQSPMQYAGRWATQILAFLQDILLRDFQPPPGSLGYNRRHLSQSCAGQGRGCAFVERHLVAWEDSFLHDEWTNKETYKYLMPWTVINTWCPEPSVRGERTVDLPLRTLREWTGHGFDSLALMTAREHCNTRTPTFE